MPRFRYEYAGAAQASLLPLLATSASRPPFAVNWQRKSDPADRGAPCVMLGWHVFGIITWDDVPGLLLT